MKTYRILRDNKETGPYPLTEMQAVKLLPTDLIWVEGESTKWDYATEFDELKNWVAEDVKTNTGANDKEYEKKDRVFVSLPSQNGQKEKSPAYASRYENTIAPAPVLETNFSESLPDIKPLNEQEEEVKNFRFENKFQRSSTFWIAALFVGLIFSAFIVRKVVDGFDQNMKDDTIATATAIPVQTPKTFDNEQPARDDYQNALSTEMVPPVHHAIVKKAKPKSLASMVTIKSSPYKVGVFGGVSNLSFKVVNSSEFTLDNVSVEVQFLKPNGKIIQTEVYDSNAIAAKSTKVLSIPPSNRGVKVKYRITAIKSKEHSKLLNA